MSKVILVTGGSRGIGAAIARMAGQAGYCVGIAYVRHRAAADEVVASIARQGGTAMAVRADVAVEEDILRLFERIDSSLGRITALVNNAGILERQMRVDDMSAEP